MTNLIDKVRTTLAGYPDVRFEVTSTEILILPANDDGFSVGLIDQGGSYTVHYDGWHEEFDDEDEALECLAFGLSDKCRLKITLRGSAPQKWTVEAEKDGAWVEDSTTGLVLFPFWRPKTTVYKRNRLIGTS